MTVVERVMSPVVVTERERRARVLEAAALEIEVRGWAADVTEDEGRVCAVGAIAAVCFESPWDIDRYSRAASEFGYVMHNEDAGGLLPRFNDAADRTADDVTFVLRWRAAEIRDGL